ncbi:hypothetical protein [Haliscomenobacter sp.]|uniref:hypothetical protein n=1 Tax=Haliscomenobacter sp. TaxID=2717303 RepID=UPI0035936CC2
MYRSLLYLLIMASVVACTQKETGEKTEKLTAAKQQEPIEPKALNFNDLTWDSLNLDTIDKFVAKTLIQDSAVYTQEEIISFVKDSSLLFRHSFNGYILAIIPYNHNKQDKYTHYFIDDLWLFDPKTNEHIATYRLEGNHYEPWGIDIKDLNKDGEQDIVASIFWGVTSVAVDFINLELIQLDKKDRKLKSTFFIKEDSRDCGPGTEVGTEIVSTFHFENKNKIAIKEEYYSFDCENYTDGGEEIKGKKKTKTLYQTLRWNEKEFHYK